MPRPTLTATDDPFWAELAPERIAIIKPSAFGDVVQTLPLLPVLRDRFPEANISWVINRSLMPLLEGNPNLDALIPYDRHGGWKGWRRLLRHLRRSRFDLVFDFQGLLRTGVMTLATGAAHRVGLETAREGSHLSCHRQIANTGREMPAHARYWRLAECLERGAMSRTTTIAITEEDRRWVVDRLSRSKAHTPVRLAVHPGARWETKRWPIEKLVHVADAFTRDVGGTVVVVGSPDEQPLADEFVNVLKRKNRRAEVLNTVGRTSLKQLAGLLERSDVLLSGDSGPMHLAAGLGTPVVSVFTCTSPHRSGPPINTGSETTFPPHRLISANIPCAASYKKRCPHTGGDHHACFDAILEHAVTEAVLSLCVPETIAKAA